MRISDLSEELKEELRLHNYVSTACFHERHEECQDSCKLCYALCKCECHKNGKDLDLIQGRL